MWSYGEKNEKKLRTLNHNLSEFVGLLIKMTLNPLSANPIKWSNTLNLTICQHIA